MFPAQFNRNVSLSLIYDYLKKYMSCVFVLSNK